MPLQAFDAISRLEGGAVVFVDEVSWLPCDCGVAGGVVTVIDVYAGGVLPSITECQCK